MSSVIVFHTYHRRIRIRHASNNAFGYSTRSFDLYLDRTRVSILTICYDVPNSLTNLFLLSPPISAYINGRLPPNSRTLVCILFMLPTIGGTLGFLLAPQEAHVGRLICYYLTGSYQASFVLGLSLITSNTAGQTKKQLTSALIWLGACVGNISGMCFSNWYLVKFFYLYSNRPFLLSHRSSSRISSRNR